MKETILGIALVAVATGIFKLLCPENSFKKQIAFLTAAFFTLSCISLFNGESEDFSDIADALRQESAYVDFSEEAYKMTQKEIVNKLTERIEALLTENKISFKEIRVVVDISSYYSISIKQVRLAFTAENAKYAAAAEALVKKEAGEETEVITEIAGR
ncbi:MAG: hypothetical protein NC203_03395 [Firmicutes bacterium]|nr:hypothetical protein [[Eubacterium] siraeum]MCM1487390.1 hypothetical protein [Bacillota bacterium]